LTFVANVVQEGHVKAPVILPYPRYATGHSHCTRAMFTVLVSRSDEHAVRVYPLLCMQR